jgi:CDP-diacylglycerol--glycerol-3-phosphate 3-phosphatidyltransferase
MSCGGRIPHSEFEMTFPTKLTLSRILLTFVLMTLLFLPGWIAKASALGCFLLASFTDWLDGYLARRWGQSTPLGILLDPIADKVLVLGSFLAFVQLRLVPAWMVLVILLRELLITGVRLYAVSRHIVIPAAAEGKHKAVSQMVAIFLVLVLLLLEESLGPADASRILRWMPQLILGAMWLAVILTVISGISFFWRNRSVLTHGPSR